MKRFWWFGIWVGVLFTASACNFLVWLGGNPGTAIDTSNSASESKEALDTTNFIDKLTDSGASVELRESVSQPFLSVQGQILRVNGEDVQVFEYPDPTVLQADTSQISPDGSSTSTTMITWIATPHFFSSGRLLVLYVGDNDDLLSTLEQMLGPQFAGG